MIEKSKWPAVIVCLAASTMLPETPRLGAQSTGIAGLVKNDAGEPSEGAIVKIQSAPLHATWLVVSKAGGRFEATALLPGKYTLQAFGRDRQSAASAVIEVPSDRAQKADLALNVPLQIAVPKKRLTDMDYERIMPEGEGKPLVTSRCATCHGLLPVISARKSPEDWQQTLEEMRDNLQDNRMPLSISRADGLTQELGDSILEYLAKEFGPNRPADPGITDHWLARPPGVSHPNRNLPATLLKGPAASFTSLEFSLPEGSEPSSIAVDSHGIAWITERKKGALGRFDPASLVYTRTPVPSGASPQWGLGALEIDAQDQVWFVDNGPQVRILRFNPQTSQFRAYPVPDYPYPWPNAGGARIYTLRVAEGVVWATGISSNKILKLDPNTGKVLQYPIPRGSMPGGLVVGSDKTIWYAAQLANSVVKMDSRTGLIGGRYKMLTAFSGLRGMAADATGNLWAAATETGKLVRVEFTNAKITEYVPPTAESGPYSVDVDTKGNLIWFSEIFADRISRFDPKTNDFVEFPLSSADADIRRIEVDRTRPNRIWWTGLRSHKIGYVEVLK